MATKRRAKAEKAPAAAPEFEHDALVIRTVSPGDTAYGGFQWPTEIGALVECPDWNPRPRCGGGCRPNQPCPRATAEQARDHLVALVGRPVGRSREGLVLVRGPALTCLSEGDGVGSRTAAWCVTAGGVDLSCAMVVSGFALRWERYWRGHRCR